MWIAFAFYSFGVAPTTQGYQASALNPHESQMARIWSILRNMIIVTLPFFIPVVAYTIFRAARNDFYEQFGLAVSFTGQALVFFGLMESVGWSGIAPWWIAAALQILVASVMPNFIQRLVAGYIAAITLSVALAWHGAPYLTSVLLTLVVVIVWMNEFQWQQRGPIVRPIGYGLTLALVQWKGQLLFGQSLHLFMRGHDEFQILMPQWLGELAIGLLLIAVVGHLMVRGGETLTSRSFLGALLVAAIVAAVSLEAPGIATGLTVILLGFSNANKILVGLGIAALLFYVSAYYYSLHATLLTKSGILAVTGATLLLARWVVLKLLFPHEESSSA